MYYLKYKIFRKQNNITWYYSNFLPLYKSLLKMSFIKFQYLMPNNI